MTWIWTDEERNEISTLPKNLAREGGGMKKWTRKISRAKNPKSIYRGRRRMGRKLSDHCIGNGDQLARVRNEADQKKGEKSKIPWKKWTHHNQKNGSKCMNRRGQRGSLPLSGGGVGGVELQFYWSPRFKREGEETVESKRAGAMIWSGEQRPWVLGLL